MKTLSFAKNSASAFFFAKLCMKKCFLAQARPSGGGWGGLRTGQASLQTKRRSPSQRLSMSQTCGVRSLPQPQNVDITRPSAQPPYNNKDRV
jgi:hypothetical protein